MDLHEYSYDLPKELIAHVPAEPRDASRLFVYSMKTDEVVFDTFAHIARYLPAGSVLVMNDTTVVPARLRLSRISGGVVRILFLFNEWDGGASIRGLPDKGVRVGEALFLDHRPIAEALSHENEEFSFKLLVPPAEFERICATTGETPLPPYIHNDMDEAERRAKYQTIFAAARSMSGRLPGAPDPASVAAPTASLHFTPEVLESLAEKGVEHASVTLHVGRGTFSPPGPAALAAGALHAEPIDVSREAAETIAAAKKSGRLVVAAGTTSTRLLESAAPDIMAGIGHRGQTMLFIRPPFQFKVVDALITNFHLPGTSLLMLLDAFLRFKGARRSWRDLYAVAIREKFRFYSFGDAMLII